jgi:hypothetical protein
MAETTIKAEKVSMVLPFFAGFAACEIEVRDNAGQGNSEIKQSTGR